MGDFLDREEGVRLIQSVWEEGCAVCEAVTGVLGVVAFGIPMLMPHDTTAYRNAMRPQRGLEASPGAEYSEVLRAS